MGQPLTAAVRLLSGEREPVRVASTANMSLSGLKTIDGVLLSVADRVLVKDQTDKRQNGIYLASVGPWFRAGDANHSRAITEGVTVHVQEGTANGGRAYRFNTPLPKIGTDLIYIDFYLSASFAADAEQVIDEKKTDFSEYVDESVSSGKVEIDKAAQDVIEPLVDEAIAARDLTAGYASDAVSQGNVPIYASVSGMASLSVPVGITALRVNGYTTPGDGGGALYKKVGSEPSHSGKFQSADGSWWEVAEDYLNPLQFGAKGNGAINSNGSGSGLGADDTSALQSAVSTVLPFGTVVDGLGRTFKITSTISLRAGMTLRNMKIDASMMPSGDTLFEAVGTEGAAVNLTANAAAGASSISVSSASGLAANDLIFISSSALFYAISGGGTYGEWARVKVGR